MEFVIGGRAQGKLAYVLQSRGLRGQDVCEGASCPLEPEACRLPVLNGLHMLVRRLLEAGAEPEAFVECVLEKNPAICVITDEIGCGIVPADAFEREWRERTGRICCTLASRAVRVERVFAGVASVIKGG